LKQKAMQSTQMGKIPWPTGLVGPLYRGALKQRRRRGWAK